MMEQQEAFLLDGPPSPSPCLPLNEGGGEGDSSSAGSGVALGGTADPVSAQLINNITMLDYRSLGNTSPLIHTTEDLSKSEGLTGGVSGGHLPHFVSWNWTLIRGVLFWGVLSALLACLAAVVALVASLPRSCAPELPWHQGQLFYEIFPASFQDSNGDGIGDLKGLLQRIDYIQGLGVKAVRLNSIFKAEYYPERYRNVSTLLEMDKSLGSLQDLGFLISALHDRNMTLVLDLPLYPYIMKLEGVEDKNSVLNVSENYDNVRNGTRNKNKIIEKIYKDDMIATALRYWTSHGIDGFYLKGIENFVSDPHFCDSIKLWKSIIGSERILMVSNDAVQKAHPPALNTLMYKIDLVDIHLNVINGTVHIKEQVDAAIKGILWSKPGFPWAHWSVGSAETRRLSTGMDPGHALAALMLNTMLPGTPSIFYGDEVGLREISQPEEDFHESEHIHNLIPMVWSKGEKQFTGGGTLPWAQGGGRTEGVPRALSALARLRPEAPSLYLNAVWKEGVGLANAQLRSSEGILTVERWAPRRNSYVFIANMGLANVSGDLSSWFYGGTAKVATDENLQEHEVIFKTISLQPAEAIVIKMEK